MSKIITLSELTGGVIPYRTFVGFFNAVSEDEVPKFIEKFTERCI